MTTSTHPRIPVYIDCDTGIDDALAIAYLLASPSIEVVGIGTVFGNTSARRATRNTLAVLELAGQGTVAVAAGADRPLAQDFDGGAPHVHGEDGVGGVALPEPRMAPGQQDAVSLLATLCRDHQGQLRVLALGPLTNLARFARTHPALVGTIAGVTVMGGAFRAAGNVSAVAEANIHNDPEAADEFFSQEWPITVLPLDITMRHTLTERGAQVLAALPGALPPVLAAMLEVYFDAYEPVYGERRCALHDPLAAIVCADAAVVAVERRVPGVGVCTQGEERGRTLARDAPVRAAAPAVRIVEEITASADDLLLAVIREHDWPERAEA